MAWNNKIQKLISFNLNWDELAMNRHENDFDEKKLPVIHMPIVVILATSRWSPDHISSIPIDTRLFKEWCTTFFRY
jgi:hypothetical protein